MPAPSENNLDRLFSSVGGSYLTCRSGSWGLRSSVRYSPPWPIGRWVESRFPVLGLPAGTERLMTAAVVHRAVGAAGCDANPRKRCIRPLAAFWSKGATSPYPMPLKRHWGSRWGLYGDIWCRREARGCGDSQAGRGNGTLSPRV